MKKLRPFAFIPAAAITFAALAIADPIVNRHFPGDECDYSSEYKYFLVAKLIVPIAVCILMGLKAIKNAQ